MHRYERMDDDNATERDGEAVERLYRKEREERLLEAFGRAE